MNEVKKKVKRKVVSKKLRFEVFKRDSFTCQYCGKKAPDSVLHIDHITPVSKGGKNTLMNLVTSCVDCNLGKGSRTLCYDSAVTASQRQAEMLQERREQIEMMRDWHLSLVDQGNDEVEAVNDLYKALTNGERMISSTYKPEIKKMIDKFGLNCVLESLRDGSDSYADPSMALNKLGGICACKTNPFYRKRAYCAAILRSKITYGKFNQYEFNKLMQRGYDAGGDDFMDSVEKWAKNFYGTWSVAITRIEKGVEDWEDEANESA